MCSALETKRNSICSETCWQALSNNCTKDSYKQNSALSLFVYAILPSTIARGIDWVGVRADTLVPVMADLRRLKDSRRCSYHVVVEYM